MTSPELRYRWTDDLPPPVREHIQGAIQLDNQRYAVVPCHSGVMTAIVRRMGASGEQYLYELRCACETVIRTDGGMLPAHTA
jgi:hypothetical protein